MVRATPIADELDLAAHGLRYLDVDPAGVNVPWDGGPAWVAFRDVERTLDSLRLSHPHEVDAYRRYLAATLPVARLLLELTSTAPTVPAVLGRLADRRGLALPRLLAMSRRSVGEVLRSFFRDEALLGPAVATGPAVWGLPPEAPGTGLGALGYAMRHLVGVGRPVGGSGALPAALAGALTAAGGRIRTGARVRRLLTGARGVHGAVLDTGEEVPARAVVTAVDPRTVLLEWLGHEPGGLAGAHRRWTARPQPLGYQSKVDAVVTAPPRLRGLSPAVLDRLGLTQPLPAQAVVFPTLAQLQAAHARLAHGEVAPRPVLLAATPSVLDPTLRVGEHHVLSLEALWTPYELRGGWAGSPEPWRWVEAFGEVTDPGLTASVIDWRVVTPRDYETGFGLRAGHAPSFPGGPLAALAGRDRMLTRYETPVPGLFLTGAGTFPGAGVWGAAGRNAAHVVLRRLGAPVG